MPQIAETRLRVRYAETDQMGFVYYSNYLVWMEIGRTDFCLQAGFRYRDMEVDDGVAIAVAEVQCRYHAPARYDENILVRTRLERLRKRTLLFSYEIAHADTERSLAEGTTKHIAVDRNTRPCSIPQQYFALLLQAESEPSRSS